MPQILPQMYVCYHYHCQWISAHMEACMRIAACMQQGDTSADVRGRTRADMWLARIDQTSNIAYGSNTAAFAPLPQHMRSSTPDVRGAAHHSNTGSRHSYTNKAQGIQNPHSLRSRPATACIVPLTESQATRAPASSLEDTYRVSEGGRTCQTPCVFTHFSQASSHPHLLSWPGLEGGFGRCVQALGSGLASPAAAYAPCGG